MLTATEVVERNAYGELRSDALELDNESGRSGANGGTAIIRHFNGYRVQTSTVRAPAKGGIRYHPQVTLNEVKRLTSNPQLYENFRSHGVDISAC